MKILREFEDEGLGDWFEVVSTRRERITTIISFKPVAGLK